MLGLAGAAGVCGLRCCWLPPAAAPPAVLQQLMPACCAAGLSLVGILLYVALLVARTVSGLSQQRAAAAAK